MIFDITQQGFKEMDKMVCDECQQRKYSTRYYEGTTPKYKGKKYCDYCYKIVVYQRPKKSWE